MFYTKKQKITYLGFNDTWFFVVGSLVLALIITFLFNSYLINDGFQNFQALNFFITFAISLLFSCLNWFLMRFALVQLRKMLPELKDSLKRSGYFFLVIVASIFLVDAIGNKLLHAFMGNYFQPMERSGFLLILVISVMTMAIYEAIYYQFMLAQAVRKEEQAKQVIVKARLDALQNQAKPHFLFNSFNTLRDIIDQDPKEKAKEFVDKLSDVYRFILDAGNSSLISLEKEVEFCKAYMHIQKERFGKSLQVEWQISEDLLSKKLVPMSLQLLLENAIKHNVVSGSKPLKIQVHATENNIQVMNPIQLKSSGIESTKLGLANIKSRYELVGEKTLEIKQEGGFYVVQLPLY